MNEICRGCGGACCKDLYIEDMIHISFATRSLVVGRTCRYLTADGLCSIWAKQPPTCRNWACGPLAAYKRRISGGQECSEV